jgi:Putative porin
MKATVFDGVTATIRLASGNDNSPVSTTQLLGGGLAKKDIWLDQAFITLDPVYWGSLTLGRMPNPFMHTDLVFDDNLNFDGAAATVADPVGGAGFSVFGALGAFPLDYVPDSFPTADAVKSDDRTKWLLALQAGAQYKPDALSWSLRGAVSFYSFENVQGVFSQPCALFDGNKQCSSDPSRPSFMQKGNTLFLLRNIIPDPGNPLNFAQPQFVGLSYNYNVLDATGEFEMPLFGTTRFQLQGDYARNLAFDPAAALSNPLTLPVTNFDAGSPGPYHSGPNAWMVKATIGYPHPGTLGDWNVVFGYKYIEPDAVLDAFNDHDFHLGGTNAKGYFVSASYFFANNTWLSGRWFSADQVFGLPLSIDVLQLELNTRF